MKVVELKIKIFERDKKYFTQIDNSKLEEFELPYPYFGNYQKIKEIDEKQLPFFGNLIFENIFCTDERLSYFENILNNLRDDILVISIISNNSTILEIPFEILSFNENILLKNPNIHLIRRVNEEVKSFESSKSIFNILFIISLPLKIYDEAPIDPLKEFSKTYEGLSEFREFVSIDILENASEKAIKEALSKKEYDIIHFSGHGVENGLVIESNENFNEERILKGKEIKEVFEGIKAKAIILDACFTSATSKEKKQNEYYDSSVSSQFENTPIVLANQSFVYDDFATFEMENIYKEIFKLKSFEILKSVRKLEHKDWWKPTLYFEANLNEKLFELKESKQDKRVIKTLNRFNRDDIYIYRYRPVREALEALRKNRRVLFRGIGGSGKSHLADYIIEMLKGKFNYIIAVDVSEYKSIKEIKSYIGDFLFKEEMFLIIDNLETLLDRDGVVVDNEIEEFLREIVSAKFRGKVLFTSRIIPSFKDGSEIVDAIVEIEPYSEAEFHNLYFAYQEANDSEVCKYLYNNREKFKEYDFYPLLISKAIENRVENIDEFILQDEEIREILEYYLKYFKESNSLLKITILKYPISKEFFEVLVKEDEKLNYFNKKLRLITFSRFANYKYKQNVNYKIYRVFQNMILLTIKKESLNNNEKELFELLKTFTAKYHFDFENSINLFEKFKFNQLKLADYYELISINYQKSDKYDIAIYCLEKSLKIRLNLKDTKNLPALYKNLGLAFFSIEKYKEAENYYNKAIEYLKEIDNNNLKSTLYTSLADVYRVNKLYEKAENYYLKAINILKSNKEKDNNLIASSLNNLAFLYTDLNNLEKSKEKFLEALEYLSKENKFFEISVIYSNLADIEIRLSNFNQQGILNYLYKALEIQEKYYPNTSTIATTYNNLGAFFFKRGEYGETERYFLKSLNIRKKIFNTENNSNIIQSYVNLVNLYFEKNQLNKLKIYLIDLEKILKVMNKKAFHLVEIYYSLGLGYHKINELNKAEEYYLNSINISNEKELILPNIYNSLSQLYQVKHKYKKAKEYIDKAIVAHQKIFNNNSVELGSYYNNLAHLFEETKEFSKAEENYLISINILENLVGETHHKTISTYSNFGILYDKKNDYSNAEKYLKKSFELLDKSYERFFEYLEHFIKYTEFKDKHNKDITNDLCLIFRKTDDIISIYQSEDVLLEILVTLEPIFYKFKPLNEDCKKRFEKLNIAMIEIKKIMKEYNAIKKSNEFNPTPKI